MVRRGVELETSHRTLAGWALTFLQKIKGKLNGRSPALSHLECLECLLRILDRNAGPSGNAY